VIDLAPTVLEVLGIEVPEAIKGVEQQPVEGTSLAYTFGADAVDDSAVPTRKTTQYFEMQGNRAIWADGWKAVSMHEHDPFHAFEGGLNEDNWELFHLDSDFSECHDLAAAEPERLQQMIDLFWSEAERYGVLPIMDRAGNLFSGHPTPGTPANRDHFTYHPPVPRIPPEAAPPLGARNWVMRFEVDRPVGGEAGVLLAFGTFNNGLVVYVDVDGHLVYDHNSFTTHTVLRSEDRVPTGRSVLEVQQQRVRRGPGRAWLLVNGVPSAEADIPLIPTMISPVGMDLGHNPTGVSSAYEAPFAFAGTLSLATIATARAFRPDEEIAFEVRAAFLTD
jgi:arylsulfatase